MLRVLYDGEAGPGGGKGGRTSKRTLKARSLSRWLAAAGGVALRVVRKARRPTRSLMPQTDSEIRQRLRKDASGAGWREGG